MKILIVDDDRQNRESLASFLERERRGLQVTLAADGAEALQVYIDHQGAFDYVVTDWQMPHIDGLSLLKIIRRLNSFASQQTLILMSTNPPDEANRIADWVLTKPFKYRDLARSLVEFEGMIPPTLEEYLIEFAGITHGGFFGMAKRNQPLLMRLVTKMLEVAIQFGFSEEDLLAEVSRVAKDMPRGMDKKEWKVPKHAALVPLHLWEKEMES